MKPTYKRNYNPTFHNDGTVTYWRDSFGWAHRVHIVTAATIGKKHFSGKYREKLIELYTIYLRNRK